jgi:GT2 family glycosyltransferase
MKKKYKNISVIFPTFNGWSDTKECLTSVENNTYPKEKLEIIIVDNNSSDSTPRLIRKNFPQVVLIQQSRNIGFAKAVNVGIKNAKGEYLLITNNDVVFDKSYFKSMFDLAETDEKIGIIGGMVYSKNPKDKVGFDGLRVNPYLGYHQYDLKNLDKIRSCDLVSGNGMFIRQKMLEKIGLFDERYFFYFEDLDLCLRAKKKDYKIIFNPKAISYHGFGRTAFKQKANDVIYQGYKSKWQCIFKNASILQIVISLIAQFTIFILAQNIISNIKTYKPMLRGVYWNIKHLRETFEARKSVYG